MKTEVHPWEHLFVSLYNGLPRGGSVCWGTALQAGRSLVRFPMASFLSRYGPGVDSSYNRNEYQEYFLGGKGGRCVGLTTLPSSCADCLEIWEPHLPGTLWACSGLYRVCFTFILYRECEGTGESGRIMTMEWLRKTNQGSVNGKGKKYMVFWHMMQSSMIGT